MTPKEVHDLLADVQADYIAMVRELNGHKRRVNPVDPWSLPLVERLERAKIDLAMVAGIKVKELP